LIVPGRDETVCDVRPWFAAFRDLEGIDFDRQFGGLAFGAQVARVAALIRGHDPAGTLLVGRSFGAWLLLHALLGQASAFEGAVLLWAPVLGYGGAGGAGFMAPRARTFWTEIGAGRPMPALRLILIAGHRDQQCPIKLARDLAKWWPIELHQYDAGHALDTWPLVDFHRMLRGQPAPKLGEIGPGTRGR